MKHLVWGSLAVVLGACGGSADGGGSAPTAPLAPTSVTITSATLSPGAVDDTVRLVVKNSGKSGFYYFDFRGNPLSSTPSGCYAAPGASCPPPPQQQIGATKNDVQSIPANATVSIGYAVPAQVWSVDVRTLSFDGVTWVVTDCLVLRSPGVCP